MGTRGSLLGGLGAEGGLEAGSRGRETGYAFLSFLSYHLLP